MSRVLGLDVELQGLALGEEAAGHLKASTPRAAHLPRLSLQQEPVFLGMPTLSSEAALPMSVHRVV